MNQKLWTPLCNLRSGFKHKSDSYWLVGISERTQACRAILCKSSAIQYPSVLPKPTIDLVQMQVPLCENTVEKTQLEQEYWKSKIVLNNIKNYENSLQNSLNLIHTNGDNTLTIGNIQFDQDDVDELNEKLFKQTRETLMKMFILACKSNKEQRAYEVSELMDTHALQLAIKYATKSRYLQLAQHLNRLAEIKTNIELEKHNEQQQQQQNHHSQDFEHAKGVVSKNADVVCTSDDTQQTTTDNDIIQLTNQTVTSTFGETSSCLTPSSGIPLTNTRFNPFKTSNNSQHTTPIVNTAKAGNSFLANSTVGSPSVISEIEDKMLKQQHKEKENQKDVWKPTPTRKLTKNKVTSGSSNNQPSPGLDKFFNKTPTTASKSKNLNENSLMDE